MRETSPGELAALIAAGDDLSPTLRAAGGEPFGGCWAFEADEIAALRTFRDEAEAHIEDPGADRPYCLAVFGPPGSGKSFAVESVGALLDRAAFDDDGSARARAERLRYRVINLTQLADVGELAAAVAEVHRDAVNARQRAFIFFDEFDAARDGVPLGWLSWFLGPMNDGWFRVDGERRRTGGAIYVFAGGTAHRATDFCDRTDRDFRDAKGPDFASRLHGRLDVRGPNDGPHRHARRAPLLAHAIGRQRARTPELTVDPALVEQVLGVDHFRHGSRSVMTLIGRCRPVDGALDFRGLPDDRVIDAQITRGPLAPDAIGGPIQVSGGGEAEAQAAIDPFWRALTVGLLDAGATLAYGGRSPADGNLSALLAASSASRIARPTRARRDGRPLVRVRWFGQPGEPKAEPIAGVERARLPTPAVQGSWPLVRAIALFQSRLAMAREAVACVAVGGAWTGGGGRMPGVLEEVYLALVHRRPVYILGGAGGAAAELGGLLGLTATWEGPPSVDASNAMFDDAFDESARDRLSPPGVERPAITARDAMNALRSHAIGAAKWPDNGLTAAENRALFATHDPDVARDLVLEGLGRIMIPG